eukprot:jgi/Sobl393_1/8841/SZX73315.1
MADPARPHAVTLLGKQLVLWRDGQGQWQCMQDACPHRLAPLSEGRIEADGTLQCSYHGWRFDSSGRCTDIPQALDAKAKAVACASSRSCVTAYPTRQQYGLIWVWPSAGPAAAAQAAAAHLPVSQKLQEAWAAGNSPTWYRRVLPYSWDILVENLSDPSHLPFSHHRLFPGLTRAAGGPMPFSAVAIPAGDSPEARAARPQYAMAHQPPLAAFEYPAGFTAGGVVAYTPPCAVVYEGKGSFVQTELLAVPSGPGQALVFTAGVSSAAKVQGGDVLKALLTNPKQVPMLLMRMKMERAPTYQSHLRSNKLFDQDGAFLHMQDVELARRGRGSWAKEYYSPVSCDSAIIAGRRWADAALQQPLNPADPSSPTAASAFTLTKPPAKRATKQQINDRMNQHTKHCSICQRALQALQRKVQAAQKAAAALAAACIGVLAGAVLPQLVAALAAGVAGFPAGAAAVLAVVLGVGAAVAKAVGDAAAKEVEQFVYVEYSHADNH